MARWRLKMTLATRPELVVVSLPVISEGGSLRFQYLEEMTGSLGLNDISNSICG